MLKPKPKVLFLSSAENRAAQIAERYAQLFLKDIIEVKSAYPDDVCQNANAILALVEDGFEYEARGPRQLSEDYLLWADYLILISDSSAEETENDLCFELPSLPESLQLIHWKIDLSHVAVGLLEDELDTFRKTREEIKLNINNLLGEFRQLAVSE